MLKTITTLLCAIHIVDASGCANEIAEFNLIETLVSPSISTALSPTVDFSDSPTCSFNIEASLAAVSTNDECEAKPVKCVKFFMNGAEVHRTNAAPFIYSDNVVGIHNLKACTYSDDECSMDESGCKEMEVEFLGCDRPNNKTSTIERQLPLLKCRKSEITGFQLVDAESPYRPDVQKFQPPVIDLLDYPTCALNIFAVVKKGSCGAPPPACVKLTLGDQVRKEVAAPYALYGNTGRFIRSGKPELGAQTLTACAYTDKKCTRGKHGCLSVNVMVKDCISMSMSM